MAVRFDAFEFDVDDGLSRGGLPIPLRRRTFAVLARLLSQPRRLVPREVLLETVWAGVAVTPGILNTSISEIRRALGDDSRHPRFIQTVHGRGFRFLVDTEPLVAPRPTDAPGNDAVAPRPSHPPLATGRTEDLDRFFDWLESVRNGSCLTVFLTGDMGIGKTRLLRAFVHSVEHGDDLEPVDVAWGQCVWRPAGEAPEPYHPVLDALDRLVRASDEARVREVLRRCAPSWTPHLPWIFAADDEGASARPAPPPNAVPTRMVRELCVAIDELTRDRPLVLVLEDLHWGDAATISLVDMLATRTEPSRLLLVLTFRPCDARADHPIARLRRVLVHRDRIVDHTLGPLSQAAVEALLLERFYWDTVPDELVRTVYRQTGGHPLLVVAVCDALVRLGVIRTEDGRSHLEGPVARIARVAPESLSGPLDHMLDSLEPLERETLEAASLVGDPFSPDQVARATATPREKIEAACASLVERTALLAEVQPAGDDSEGRYRFRIEALAELLRHRAPADLRWGVEQRLRGAAPLRVMPPARDESGDDPLG